MSRSLINTQAGLCSSCCLGHSFMCGLVSPHLWVLKHQHPTGMEMISEMNTSERVCLGVWFTMYIFIIFFFLQVHICYHKHNAGPDLSVLRPPGMADGVGAMLSAPQSILSMKTSKPTRAMHSFTELFGQRRLRQVGGRVNKDR